ncbi:carbamoyltransferase HypF [Mailhella massiliensis]|uniref:carbamoyltransferase HypF n=1 Tax=Mailhella massiliensis TaxID=1903261 RepID=UPI0023574659|nr:carbamoyltransferase HypF [Mailhella massiliensis]
MRTRHIYILTGQVQGVGFRPFIYREAARLRLTGFVGNTPEGVRIEVQGEENALLLFSRFSEHLPPLARIASLTRRDAPLLEGEDSFRIEESSAGKHRGHSVLVSPDVAPCSDCLDDMADPENRRFGYAFTNCTNCGPRYTITRSIPYDRPVTSMACFPMCGPCAEEYHNPADRRFHAQPDACPDCGPVLWLEDGRYENELNAPLPQTESPALAAVYEKRRKLYGLADGVIMGKAAIPALLAELGKGRIAAVRGLGGFHLVCDAHNESAVAELRRRKARPHKALAVMAADVESASRFAHIGRGARDLLLSPARPIVICPRKRAGEGEDVLPALLAPDSASIGIMLPSTPLHHLLFHPEWAGGNKEDALSALVMTSGNPHGAPICLGNREAKKRLGDMADLFLFHDRDILVRVDDSVVFPGEEKEHAPCAPELMVRRARGFVPTPLSLPPRPAREAGDCVFAAGAELKHTFCLTRGAEAFVSQHIGDVSRAEHLAFFEETLRHLTGLLEVEPGLVVRDLHPDFLSSRLADDVAQRHGLRELFLQHHVAHVCAVMAEHGLTGPVLGLALDGSGLGDDDTVWGGELLLVRPGAWQRLGRFSPFLLPGGEAAIRSPWRTAEALWRAADLPDRPRPWLEGSPERARLAPMVREMMTQGINCPKTSSCGRLFDAVAALCGLCFDITYEGQAAVRLEEAQDASEQGAYDLPLIERDGLLEADVAALFRHAANDCRHPGRAARRFHDGLVRGLARWARLAADGCGISTVALCGGVFNNRTLLACLPEEMRRLGLTPLVPRRFPAGDGAVSLGQALWGDWFLGA